MTTRTFHVGDILSAMTGRVVSPRHVDGVYDLLGWMVDEKLMTHQLPRVSEECGASLRAQFPDLAAIVIPDGLRSEEAVLYWLAAVVSEHGATRPVARLDPLNHARIDLLAEARTVAPNAVIVPVVLSAGGTSAPTYPLPPPEKDDRFTFGLALEVADVLEKAGFPGLGGSDLTRLQQHLFRFLYGKREEN